MTRLRIAVAGSGVSGLAAAWLLAKSHDVTVFEQDTRLGGHANTVDVQAPEGVVPIDTGFIVYNTACYPNLIALFEHLGVPTAATRMGFAVSMDAGGYEYSGSGAQGLFGQPSNLLHVAHWQMVRDILRFFREAPDLLTADASTPVSLGQWLVERNYSRAFIDRHILPMAAAIWSAPVDHVMAFPAVAFARFFANHGLLQVRNRPQWRTVRGGSRAYVQRLEADFSGQIQRGTGVKRVQRVTAGVDVTLNDGQTRRFDHVVLACHADQALALLADPSTAETALLAPFRYQSNLAVLHTDTTCMPTRKRLWSSWNYVGRGGPDQQTDQLTVSYWMNALQPLATRTNYFVTLNPAKAIAADQTIQTFDYAHPVFDAGALVAQRDLWRLQGQRGTWFAGSYFGSGFHEDAIQSGLWVGEQLGGVRRPWTVEDASGRLFLGVPKSVQPYAEAAE
jgi:uncharacterized protein